MKAWTLLCIACALLSHRLLAEERLTYERGESWVSRYLEAGGDMKNITGLVLPSNWKDEARFNDLRARRDLPAMFDWRWKAEGLQPIRNQKSCGSCWAFSITATLEALVKIQTGKIVDLAEQTLVSTCESGGDCGGGYFTAFNYVKNPGLPDEAQDPYLAKNSSCKSGLKVAEKAVSWAYVGSRDRAPTTEQIKTALMKYGPLSVGVCANGSFSSYKSGVFNSCSSCGVNHMVNIEGWNDEGQYWIMRNSWGTDWGENGYMNIKYVSSGGSKCNRIAEQTAYAVYGDGVIDH